MTTASSTNALQRVLDETRQRFVDTFLAQCDSIRVLVDDVAADGPNDPLAALTQVSHRLCGLAGMIGFPTIGARASELEGLAGNAGRGAFDAARARHIVDAMRDAFTSELASTTAWPPAPASGAPDAKAGVTVVVAEDDPDITRIIDAQVRAAGYTVITAPDGEQALAAVREHRTDVLVLDLMMPRLNGFDVLMQVRKLPAPRPRIVVLSARGREQDVMRAFDLGADDYMTKPFNPQELVARVARLLR